MWKDQGGVLLEVVDEAVEEAVEEVGEEVEEVAGEAKVVDDQIQDHSYLWRIIPSIRCMGTPS